MMFLNEYQQRCKNTAVYPKSIGVLYTTLGLCGEAGEVAEKVKKVHRDKDGKIDEAERSAIKKELGDALWYISMLGDELGITLEDIAQTNLDKLKARKEAGALHGSGDGLEELIKNGQLPETSHFPGTFQTWNHLMLALDELYLEKHEFKTLILDTLNGACNLCTEDVVQNKFKGNVENFEDYGRGMKPSFMPKEWQSFLDKLDALRAERNMAIILLAHSQVKTVNNPGASNFDRWEPVMPKEIAAITDRWVDMILFGGFEVTVESKKLEQKGKAVGGNVRMLYTQPDAAYNAGNRAGLPAEIECGTSPKEAWTNFLNAMREARKASN